jgi:hypothetical protein
MRVFNFSNDIGFSISDMLARLNMPVLNVDRPEQFYVPKLKSAEWIAVSRKGVQPYAMRYRRTTGPPLAAACDLAQCFHKTADMKDAARCFYQAEPSRQPAKTGDTTETTGGVAAFTGFCWSGQTEQVLVCSPAPGSGGFRGRGKVEPVNMMLGWDGILLSLAEGEMQLLSVQRGSTFRSACGDDVALVCPNPGVYVPLVKVDN